MLTFSSEERALAQSEGWTKYGNAVRSLIRGDGSYYFLTQHELHTFLYNRAKTSEFHFNVCCGLSWNIYDAIAARSYGFTLYSTAGKIEDRTGYTSVQEHMEQIAQRSATDPVCAKALKIITKHRLTNGDAEWQPSG